MWMTKWHGTFLPGGLFCVLRVEVVIPAYTLLIHRGVPPRRQLYCIFQLMKKQNVIK